LLLFRRPIKKLSGFWFLGVAGGTIDRGILLLPPLVKFEGDYEGETELINGRRLPGSCAIRAAKQQTDASPVTAEAT
jgi:hypothetical protein